MKNLSRLFLALLGTICFSQVAYSQDRVSHEPTIEVNIVKASEKITRYVYRKASSDWSESQSTPIKGYGKVSYKGVDYIAIVLHSGIGWYKYPKTTVDWQSVYFDGYALFTQEQFNDIVPSDDSVVKLTPAIYFSVWGDVHRIKPLDNAEKFAFERAIDSGGSLTGFNKYGSEDNTIDKNDIVFCIKSWKEVIRFDTPRSNSHKQHHRENFDETQLDTSYYEVPVSDFINYMDKIRNFDMATQESSSQSSSKKSSKKKK